MQYLLIISHDDAFVPTGGLVAEIMTWISTMQARGIRKHGNPLRPPADATTVRVRAGEVQLTPGTRGDGGEKIAAYELLECLNLDEAIDAAAKHPMARAATIEVRPVWMELAARS